MLLTQEFCQRLLSLLYLGFERAYLRALFVYLARERGDGVIALLYLSGRLGYLRVKRGDVALEVRFFCARVVEHLLPLRNFSLELVVLNAQGGLFLVGERICGLRHESYIQPK